MKFIVGDLDLTYNAPRAKDYIHKGGFKRDVPLLEDVVVIEGAGHFIHQERPDEINKHIYNFFRNFWFVLPLEACVSLFLHELHLNLFFSCWCVFIELLSCISLNTSWSCLRVIYMNNVNCASIRTPSCSYFIQSDMNNVICKRRKSEHLISWWMFPHAATSELFRRNSIIQCYVITSGSKWLFSCQCHHFILSYY